jgi:serine/threonine protein kinase
MPQDRWNQVGGLLEEVLARPEEERPAFLREACADPAVRAEITSLLELTGEARDYFDRLASAVQGPQEAIGSDVEAGADPLGLAGTRVGRYAVEGHLGGGGMGLVYRARDTQLGRPVALKFLPPHLSRSEEAEERFVREAQAAARLDHPNVATVHEIGATDAGRRYIAMAYYEGETLKETLAREGPLPVDEAVGYAIQIAEGLAAAHDAGIVHRDVKPANVIINDAEEVKLVDFGLARVAEATRLTNPGRRLGTAAYMSPEQARGEAVDARTDLWALGVLLYEMLTGERPFQAASETAVLRAVLHDEPDPVGERRNEVPAAVEDVVGRLLMKDSDERYASAEALVEDLRAARSMEPSDASVTSPSAFARVLSAARRPADWKRRWIVGGGAVLAVLLFVLGWALWPTEPASNKGSAADSAPATAGTSPQSIAVLPFESIGSGEDDGFTEGIHGDILTRLSNISDLTVISRTSVQQYRKAETPTSVIGEELGAGWVLEGEVQEVGGTVQVNARLINAQTDQEAWARSYRRELTAENLFEIQEEITRDIADALHAELTAGEQERIAGAPTEDLQAYRLYVQGRQELAQRGFGYDTHVEHAVRYFRRAIERDSSFALAWAGLADAAEAPLGEVPDSAWVSEISQEAAARRALELDPDLAEAHASIGFVHYTNQNAPAALRALTRAIELKPSYWEAHQMLGWVYFILQKDSQAMDHFQLAVELNPRHARARHGLYDAYNVTGQPRKSLREARRQQRMGLEETGAVGGEVRALRALGRLEEAQQLAEKQIAELGAKTTWGRWFRVYLVDMLAAKGDTAGARKYLGQLQETNAPPDIMATAYRDFGEVDKALQAYAQLEGEDWYFVPMSGIRELGEYYPSIRDDSLYRKVLRRANQTWGLNPDGSIPGTVDAPLSADPETDA